MNGTKIEWVKNPDGTQGYTWNPITGCLNHVNGLCKGGGFPCYAYKLAHGRLKQRYLANDNLTPCSHGSRDSICVTQDDLADPFYPRFWKERLLEPLEKTKQSGVFVCDMSDLFGIGIPEEWTNRVLKIIKYDTQFENTNRYYLLTKQPQNLPREFPENCWVGVTATDGEMYQRGMIYLAQIEAKVKYMSFEPLLGRVTFFEKPIVGLDWLIIGAQTKPYKPPKIEWIREIVEAADKAGISVFLKDNLRFLLPYTEPFYRPVNNKVELRQEMPKGQKPLDIISTDVLQYCHKLTEGGRHENSGGGC